MKNIIQKIITDRKGQVISGLLLWVIVAVIAAPIIFYTGKKLLDTGSGSIEMGKIAPTASNCNPDGTGKLGFESECEAEKTKAAESAAKKAADAGIVSPGEQLKDAVAQPACDPNGDATVYLNCINNEKRLEQATTLCAPGEEEAACNLRLLKTQYDTSKDVFSWLDLPIIKRPLEFLGWIKSFFISTPTPPASCLKAPFAGTKSCPEGTVGTLTTMTYTYSDCTQRPQVIVTGGSCSPIPENTVEPAPKPAVTTPKPSGGTTAPKPTGGTSGGTKAPACVPYDPYSPENTSINLAKVRSLCGSVDRYNDSSAVLEQYDSCVSTFWSKEEAKAVECP